MASTNKEAAANSSPQDPAIQLNQQQEQQQELIKLLTQHFHHQFYQLSSESNSRLQATQDISDPTMSTYQSNRAIEDQFACLNWIAARKFDLARMGHLMVGNPNTEAVAFAGHHRLQPTNRSQETHANCLTGMTNLNPSINQEASASFQTQAGGIFNSHQSMSDLSLLNALGLNLNNNQLMLSLQQQSLLQAAATNSRQQYDLNAHNLKQTQSRFDRPNSNSLHQATSENMNLQTFGQPTECNGALKFSINTILGRGSPQSSMVRLPKTNPPRSPSTRSKATKTASYAEEEQENSDCDPIAEFGSDTSSTHTTTPVPQITSNSILYQSQAQVTTPTRHSATDFGLSGSFAGHQGTQTMRHSSQHHSLPFLAGSNAFPWTVAARGKPRRGMMRRAVFSDGQRVGLEKRFQLQKYISKPDRKKLAEKLGLRDSQVKIWFQNRRMKWRNSKERELLSAGGSREQTLPTRNNPNPDLSDVGETVKRLSSTSSSRPESAATTTTPSTNCTSDLVVELVNK